jgi:parallel beta-helix repeat protein
MILAPVGAVNVTVNSGMKNSDIQNIINNAKAGDTINFNEGNYQNVSLVINKKLNVVSKKAVLNGNNSDKTNGQTTFVFCFTNKSSGAFLSGFNIKTNTDYAIILNNVKNVNIVNNRINGGNKGSIYIKASSNINLTKNTITNSGGNGVTIYASNAVNLYRNIIYKNHGDGVTVKNSQSTSLVLNQILSSGLNGITLNSTTNTVVHNNSINKNNCEGIVLYDTITTYITGNNITYNTLNGILFQDWTKNTFVSFNYLIHNLNGIYLDSVSYGDIIVSNYIARNNISSLTQYDSFYTGNGIKVGDNYQDTNQRVLIAYNTFAYKNPLRFNIMGNNNYNNFNVGPNWYGTNDKWSSGVCPMISTCMLKAKFGLTPTGFEMDIFDPSTNQVAPLATSDVNVIISKVNADGSTTTYLTTKGQIVNGKLVVKAKLDKNSKYSMTVTTDDGNSVSGNIQTDSTYGQSENNGKSPTHGNSTNPGTGNKTTGNGVTANNGNGIGHDGNGTSANNGTSDGSGKDLTQVGLEGGSANNGGQQSAGDESGSMSGVEVAVKNAVNQAVTNPFNSLGIIALLGLIGIGYFKRDKFK